VRPLPPLQGVRHAASDAARLRVLQMLRISSISTCAPLRPIVQAAHLFAEAGRLAYADRNLYIAIPRSAAAPLGGAARLEVLDARAKLIDPKRSMGTGAGGRSRASAARYGLAEPLELPSTTHVSVVRRGGQRGGAPPRASRPLSANRQMVRGFLLNNELTDFPGARGSGKAVSQPRRSTIVGAIELRQERGFDAVGDRPSPILGLPGKIRELV